MGDGHEREDGVGAIAGLLRRYPLAKRVAKAYSTEREEKRREERRSDRGQSCGMWEKSISCSGENIPLCRHISLRKM